MVSNMNKKRLEINITINEETNIFNKFNNEQLSEDLSDYIYSNCKGNSINKNITINIIHKHKLKNEEKHKIIDAIRANYGMDIRENNMKIKYEIIIEILLVIIGSILISFSQLIDALNIHLIDEIISIFGCMIVWEVAYNIIFNNSKMYIENKRLRKLTEARINFKEEKNGK